jgi:NADH-quinone oxidoreductase subunit F
MEEQLVLLKRIREHDEAIVDIDLYEKSGGYEALKMALKDMSPEKVKSRVKDSDLRGRGGAGFSTGMKWGFVPMGDDVPRPKFLVCNCDEMEPGTFKDRLLIERDPHQLIEGMIIAAYAMDMDEGYIYVRWAYKEGQENLKKAIIMARERGYLGKNILGSSLSFDIHVHSSAGRYIIGEETAMLNAIEGRRGNPRSKPPFPPIKGLWQRPTIVNNVETLSCISHITQNGARWFRALGATEDAGTKVYCISGRVNKPGCYEMPIGVPLNEIIDEQCGGMQGGYQIQSIIPGGASTDFLTPGEFDVKMDFTHLEAIGNRLGTAAIMVIDDHTDLVGFAANLQRFFAQESCGWCTPCREGLGWMSAIMDSFAAGEGLPEELNIILEQAGPIGRNSFCAHALGAAGPLLSAVKKFRHLFDEKSVAHA